MVQFSLRSPGKIISLALVAILVCIISINSLSNIIFAQSTSPVPGSLYSYNFAEASAEGVVLNNAERNTSTSMRLLRNWNRTDFGVRFDGNRTDKISVGYADPSSGNTISITAAQALGGSILLKYEAPQGATCFSDSRNVAQIGRYAAGTAQMKIQFSNCGTNRTAVYPECRVAGSKSVETVKLARSSMALENGGIYIIRCVKSPDSSTTTTVTLSVTKVDAAAGNQTTHSTNTIPAAGSLTSTSALSVANKYPLPKQTANTDQFAGEMAKVVFCGGGSTNAAVACLQTEIPETTPVPEPTPEPEQEPTPQPEPTSDPTFTEFVKNTSFETDLSGWTGSASTTSRNTRVSGGFEGSYAVRSINSGTTTGKSGFGSKPSWIDGVSNSLEAGKAYTASVWVKPGAADQKIVIYLREQSASGSTVGSRTVTLTAGNTDWQQITNTYIAKASGSSLAFQVYVTNAAPQAGFIADTISLRTLN